MKKTLLLLLGVLVLSGCRKDDIFTEMPEPTPNLLEIKSSVGIKLESAFVTSEVSMNVKTETSGVVTIKIFDISNRVVSKETTTVKVGDNILKVYTTALPSSAYRIGLFDSNNKMLGITDFNKL
jgi:hypothetical protein